MIASPKRLSSARYEFSCARCAREIGILMRMRIFDRYMYPHNTIMIELPLILRNTTHEILCNTAEYRLKLKAVNQRHTAHAPTYSQETHSRRK